MAQSLAVKYRPHTFEDVCSQTSTIKILQRQLEYKQFKNSYIFSGASGCGKTTCARIFANLINENVGTPIEIDAASNNGVDNVKQIVKSAQERSIDSVYKIYIIDEAHMLTTQSWNAFLKCIEEPPTYTIFIFCTTDPQKIPATIQNRCQRFNFNKIPVDIIKERLRFICVSEGFTNFEDSLDFISKICDGGMRDAISTLEKCAGYDTSLTLDNVLAALGNYSYESFFSLINGVIDGDEKTVLSILDQFHSQGGDLRIFIDQFLTFCLDVTKYAIFKNINVTKLPATMEENLKKATNFDNPDKYYIYVVDKILEMKNMIKNDTNIKTTLDVLFLKLTRLV